MLVKQRVNTCDNIYNELMIHFTQACENKCFFCIDAMNKGVGKQKPNIAKILESVFTICEKTNIVAITISGGEPCLYLDQLLILVQRLKTRLPFIKVGVISSMPTQCFTKSLKLFRLLEMVDNFAFTPQHYDEDIADKIRGVKSKYNHQELYASLPYKEKICVNININKPYLCDKKEICKCIKHYNDMGFNTIRLAELFDCEENYASFEDIFNVKLHSPFACGCKINNFDITPWIPSFKGNLILKRSCFLVNKKQHCSFNDLIKIVTRPFYTKDFAFAVIYEDGSVHPYWC